MLVGRPLTLQLLKKNRSLLFSVPFLFLASCALAPFSEPYSAQTLGKGKSEISIRAGSPNFGSVEGKYGLNDRLDLGILLESQIGSFLAGASGKYYLFDVGDSGHFSLYGGAGFGASSTYVFAGPIYSLDVNSNYQISFNARYNVYTWDFSDANDEQDAAEELDDFADLVLDSLSGTYSYLSLNMSNSYWFSEGVGVTFSLTGLYFIPLFDVDEGDFALKFSGQVHFKL